MVTSSIRTRGYSGCSHQLCLYCMSCTIITESSDLHYLFDHPLLSVVSYSGETFKAYDFSCKSYPYHSYWKKSISMRPYMTCAWLVALNWWKAPTGNCKNLINRLRMQIYMEWRPALTRAKWLLTLMATTEIYMKGVQLEVSSYLFLVAPQQTWTSTLRDGTTAQSGLLSGTNCPS